MRRILPSAKARVSKGRTTEGGALMAAHGMDFDCGMPGLREQLTGREIWNILGFIKSTWPDWIREIQAVRTDGEAHSREK